MEQKEIIDAYNDYRADAMELQDRLDTMSEEEQLRLLASDGMLVRRPLLVSGETVIPGFREKDWEAVL